uniref:Uncharacterized protein n=1 Tax=Anguilla anguilla TaxID=7936 RepID=A0A0E9V5S3_ANGAN
MSANISNSAHGTSGEYLQFVKVYVLQISS